MNDQALSPLAKTILEKNPSAYTKLVVPEPAPPETITLLKNVTPQQLLSAPEKSPPYAQAVLAGLWLWHDGLDECHGIVQQSTDPATTPTYSFWHAIMHRREGDFSNSKYWYARASSHPLLPSLQAQATPIVNRAPADKMLLRLISSGWNPNAFVDFVESVHDDVRNPLHEIAVEIQRIEWLALFDHCARLA